MTTQPAITSRRLRRQESDRYFFDLVEQWRAEYPAWLRDINSNLEEVWSTADIPEYINIGIWRDGEPYAFLTYRHTVEGWWESHLESKRGAKAEELDGVIWEWGWGVFRDLGAEAIFAWIPVTNRVSAKMTEALQLHYDGTLRWYGTLRGKVLKWRRHTFYRKEWLYWYNLEEATRVSKTKDGDEAGYGNSVRG